MVEEDSIALQPRYMGQIHLGRIYKASADESPPGSGSLRRRRWSFSASLCTWVIFWLHLQLRSGTHRSEKPGLWFTMVKDGQVHEALRKREDRALCKRKHNCWAVKSTRRRHSQVHNLKLFVTSFWKTPGYQTESGHIDSTGWGVVQRSLS